MAKEYIENASESSHSYLRDRGHSNNRGGSASGQMGGYSGGGHGGNFGGQIRNFGGQWKDNEFKGKNDSKLEDIMKKFLGGHKFQGREFYIQYNLRDEGGEPKCKDRRCARAHNCAFIPRDTNKPCGKPHPKFMHNKF